MRTYFRFICAMLILFSGWWAVPSPRVIAANLDPSADHVFGQPDFTSNTLNGGLSAHSLQSPQGAALDAQGNLYVSDGSNNRVLEFDAPLSAGSTADRVFGQPDFTSSIANHGNLSALSLNGPSGVAVDAQGNLYVADQINNRVLEYNTPLTSDLTADRVFGQPDFMSNTANNGGVSDHSLASPFDVALDAKGNLYVADANNNRLLFYDTPPEFDTFADQVFGQPNFISNTANNGGVSATSLNVPLGVILDAQGNLYLADALNNRVLEYDIPPTISRTAKRVFGQPTFTSNDPNHGSLSANSLNAPVDVGVDAQGDVYVADGSNNRVLEYDAPLKTDRTADRVFGQPNFTSSIANNGGLSALSLFDPSSVAVDTQGNLYVVDHFNNRVLEYDVAVPYSVPTLNAISPSTVAAGSLAFTLTVSGAGFVAGSSVRWNGSDRPTTFLSTSQLNASISGADVAAGGSFSVTVFTPAPGGGISNSLTFTLYSRVGQDATADSVLGQPNFSSSDPNNTRLPGGANRLFSPGGAVIDPRSGRLFVSDSVNNRVLSWPTVPEFANGQAADLVIGQPDFSIRAHNFGSISASSLDGPTGVALDAQGDLYIADTLNNRVLMYTAPLTNGKAASLVFGQNGSFATLTSNLGGVNANSLFFPYGVGVDVTGNLYIADLNNNRVLEYDTPTTDGFTADHVFGQPDFISNTANFGGINANSLAAPISMALDAQGNLFVADQDNHRVLEYDTPLTTGFSADRVFGQPDFTSNNVNNGGISASSLWSPLSVALDARGNLFVADATNNRVLEYDSPLNNPAADRVFGQPDFTSNTANNGGISAKSLQLPAGVAMDSQNNLYVVDSSNHRILEYDWALVKIRLPYITR